MSEKKTPDDYEVGYGKPPKETQFQKGRSGNPRGRPKKAPDFNRELIRESQTLITINENGRRIRITKHGVAVKQLLKHAMSGSPQGLRLYFGYSQSAFEMAALSAAQKSSGPKDSDNPMDYTEKELERFLLKCLEDEKRKLSSNMH